MCCRFGCWRVAVLTVAVLAVDVYLFWLLSCCHFACLRVTVLAVDVFPFDCWCVDILAVDELPFWLLTYCRFDCCWRVAVLTLAVYVLPFWLLVCWHFCCLSVVVSVVLGVVLQAPFASVVWPLADLMCALSWFNVRAVASPSLFSMTQTFLLVLVVCLLSVKFVVVAPHHALIRSRPPVWRWQFWGVSYKRLLHLLCDH